MRSSAAPVEMASRSVRHRRTITQYRSARSSLRTAVILIAVVESRSGQLRVETELVEATPHSKAVQWHLRHGPTDPIVPRLPVGSPMVTAVATVSDQRPVVIGVLGRSNERHRRQVAEQLARHIKPDDRRPSRETRLAKPRAPPGPCPGLHDRSRGVESPPEICPPAASIQVDALFNRVCSLSVCAVIEPEERMTPRVGNPASTFHLVRPWEVRCRTRPLL